MGDLILANSKTSRGTSGEKGSDEKYAGRRHLPAHSKALADYARSKRRKKPPKDPTSSSRRRNTAKRDELLAEPVEQCGAANQKPSHPRHADIPVEQRDGVTPSEDDLTGEEIADDVSGVDVPETEACVKHTHQNRKTSSCFCASSDVDSDGYLKEQRTVESERLRMMSAISHVSYSSESADALVRWAPPCARHRRKRPIDYSFPIDSSQCSLTVSECSECSDDASDGDYAALFRDEYKLVRDDRPSAVCDRDVSTTMARKARFRLTRTYPIIEKVPDGRAPINLSKVSSSNRRGDVVDDYNYNFDTDTDPEEALATARRLRPVKPNWIVELEEAEKRRRYEEMREGFRRRCLELETRRKKQKTWRSTCWKEQVAREIRDDEELVEQEDVELGGGDRLVKSSAEKSKPKAEEDVTSRVTDARDTWLHAEAIRRIYMRKAADEPLYASRDRHGVTMRPGMPNAYGLFCDPRGEEERAEQAEQNEPRRNNARTSVLTAAFLAALVGVFLVSNDGRENSEGADDSEDVDVFNQTTWILVVVVVVLTLLTLIVAQFMWKKKIGKLKKTLKMAIYGGVDEPNCFEGEKVEKVVTKSQEMPPPSQKPDLSRFLGTKREEWEEEKEEEGVTRDTRSRVTRNGWMFDLRGESEHRRHRLRRIEPRDQGGKPPGEAKRKPMRKRKRKDERVRRVVHFRRERAPRDWPDYDDSDELRSADTRTLSTQPASAADGDDANDTTQSDVTQPFAAVRGVTAGHVTPLVSRELFRRHYAVYAATFRLRNDGADRRYADEEDVCEFQRQINTYRKELEANIAKLEGRAEAEKQRAFERRWAAYLMKDADEIAARKRENHRIAAEMKALVEKHNALVEKQKRERTPEENVTKYFSESYFRNPKDEQMYMETVWESVDVIDNYIQSCEQNKWDHIYRCHTSRYIHDWCLVKMSRDSRYDCDFYDAGYVHPWSDVFERVLDRYKHRLVVAAAPMFHVTIGILWHWIYENDVKLVVVLNAFIERNIMQCLVWFPLRPGQVMRVARNAHRDYEIRCLSAQSVYKKNGIERVFEITLIRDNQRQAVRKRVTHIHMLDWKQDSIPPDWSHYVDIAERLKEHSLEQPAVVMSMHGSGRAMTLILSLMAAILAPLDDDVSIHAMVHGGRASKRGAVTAKVQIFFWRMLHYELLFKWFPSCEKFRSRQELRDLFYQDAQLTHFHGCAEFEWLVFPKIYKYELERYRRFAFMHIYMLQYYRQKQHWDRRRREAIDTQTARDAIGADEELPRVYHAANERRRKVRRAWDAPRDPNRQRRRRQGVERLIFKSTRHELTHTYEIEPLLATVRQRVAPMKMWVWRSRYLKMRRTGEGIRMPFGMRHRHDKHHWSAFTGGRNRRKKGDEKVKKGKKKTLAVKLMMMMMKKNKNKKKKKKKKMTVEEMKKKRKEEREKRKKMKEEKKEREKRREEEKEKEMVRKKREKEKKEK